jgi:hypothetical protein
LEKIGDCLDFPPDRLGVECVGSESHHGVSVC